MQNSGLQGSGSAVRQAVTATHPALLAAYPRSLTETSSHTHLRVALVSGVL